MTVSWDGDIAFPPSNNLSCMAVPLLDGPEQLAFALAAEAEARDAYTESHAQRVASSALHMGTRLGLQECSLLAL